MIFEQTVLNIWLNTNQYLLTRKEYVENYATFLMSIETARSTRTSTALTAMATSMINVGYILRDEAVRIVEARTFLVNGK